MGGALTLENQRRRRRDCRRDACRGNAPRAKVRAWRATMADTLRLMLVDDHYLVRLGLSSVIALEPDMTVCAEAATGDHAIELFRLHRPDVTLMDLRLPDLSGTEAIRARSAPSSRTRESSRSRHSRATKRFTWRSSAGALAYLVKTVQPEELVETIRKVADGQRHVPAGSRGAARAALAALASVSARARSAQAHDHGASATRRSPATSTSPKAP